MTEIVLPRAIRAVASEGVLVVPAVLIRLDRCHIDAIRLATAQVAPTATPLIALVTYHRRLRMVAEAMGMPTAAPSLGENDRL